MIRILAKQINTESEIYLQNVNISDYKITDYFKIVKAVIPLEEQFINETVEEELDYYIDQLFLSKEEKNKRLKNIIKNLNISKIKKTNIKDLTQSEQVLLQIALCVAAMPKVLLIDDLSYYLTSMEVKKIITYFKYLVNNYDITIFINSTRLEDIIETDYLYILSNNQIVLKGLPQEVLQKDNLLNRAGIRVPFMIDLSVKLKDYNLLNEVELDIDRMVDKLWN